METNLPEHLIESFWEYIQVFSAWMVNKKDWKLAIIKIITYWITCVYVIEATCEKLIVIIESAPWFA
jgi:hypothetical protein